MARLLKIEDGIAPKSLAERRQASNEQQSFEILDNPPDKYTNGDVIGFTPYFTTQFGLPHTRVEGNMWQRRNGREMLSVYTDCPYGLPSGSKPRLLLAWIATWQVRHPNQTVIELGKNVSDFMQNELKIPLTGRYIKEIRLEMIRLFSSTISLVTIDSETVMYKREKSEIAGNFTLWGSPKADLNQDSLFSSFVELDPKFRESILERPVPIDLRAFHLLRGSSLAMDYYTWFAHTMFSLRKSRLVPWKALHDQLGSNYDWSDKRGRHNFRAESAKQIIKRVRLAYPNLLVTPGEKGIMLHPSPTPVPYVSSTKTFVPGVRKRRLEEANAKLSSLE